MAATSLSEWSPDSRLENQEPSEVEAEVIALMRSAFEKGLFYRHPKWMSEKVANLCWDRALHPKEGR